MKYIGIRGHRGAGKNTIAYLIGVAIDYLQKNKTFVDFEATYNAAVEECMNNVNFITEANLKHVYFESFADTLRAMLSQLTNIPFSWMNSDSKKDNVYINLKTFEYTETQDFDKSLITNALDLFYERTELIKTGEPLVFDTKYITLREFIIYFGYISKFYFGKNVWVKSLKVNQKDSDTFWDDYNMYKIFTDVKFPTEVGYIKDLEGCIICVNRPSNVKKKSVLSDALVDDTRIDYEIIIGNSLYKLRNKIENIVLDICKN